MWPWSTIKGLRGDLKRADTLNLQLNDWLECYNRTLQHDSTIISDLRAQIRKQSDQLFAAQAAARASETTRKQLAAERDEAVLRTRGLEKKALQLLNEFKGAEQTVQELRKALSGALVRDSKGRLTKHDQPQAEVCDVEKPTPVNFRKDVW